MSGLGGRTATAYCSAIYMKECHFQCLAWEEGLPQHTAVPSIWRNATFNVWPGRKDCHSILQCHLYEGMPLSMSGLGGRTATAYCSAIYMKECHFQCLAWEEGLPQHTAVPSIWRNATFNVWPGRKDCHSILQCHLHAGMSLSISGLRGRTLTAHCSAIYMQECHFQFLVLEEGL